jgi:hypothetical protein
MSRGRLPVLLVIVGLLVAGGIADRAGRASTPHAVALAPGPHAAPASATSSTWYCTGAQARPDGPAVGTVVVANAGSRTLLGTITVVPDNGSPRSVPLRVAGPGSASVRLADVVTADNASALIELDGGQVVAELVTQGPLGDSVTPCASSASDSWYFAEGATTRDANEVLMVFNPFPEDALVDFSFSTETDRVVPEALAGLVVKGRGMVAVPVGDSVRRRAAVSTVVKSRVGRLVVARVQVFDGTGDVPRTGVSIALGAPAPRPVWYFPEGYAGDGVTERIQVYNPSAREARVSIEMLLDEGEADPVGLTVPAYSRVTFTVNEEPRVPPNVGHAAVVRALNGVPVVAERTVDAVAPSARTGFAVTLGATGTAARWAFAAGEPDPAVEEWVTVLNPDRRPATVGVTALVDGGRARVPELQRLSVPARGRLVIRLADHLPRPVPAVVVEATGPVVVERDLYATGAPGRAMAMGTPL